MVGPASSGDRLKSVLRLGLIGAGRIGRVHARAVAAIGDDVRLSMVADSDMEAGERLAASTGAIACSPAELIRSGCLDAVIVATPPDSHEALSLALLNRGIAVLCEKPLGVTLDAAHRLQAASTLTGALLCVSSKFVFADAVVTLAAMIRRGEIEASSLSLDFSLGLDLAGSWQVDPLVGGGGVVMDRAPQALDIVRALLGEPQRISASCSDDSPYRVEDAVEMRVDVAEGRHADVILSWRQTSQSDVYARLIGDEQVVELGWSRARIWRPERGWLDFGPGYDQNQAFASQLRAFVRAVRGEADFDAPLAGAIANQVMIDGLYRAWIEESLPRSA